MIYGFYFFLTLGIVIFQTSILPLLSVSNYVYDVMIPLVVYLAGFRATREGVMVIVILGGVMDSLSGAPFGIFFSCYLWLFIMVKGIGVALNVGSNLVLPFVIALGVLVENLIFVGMAPILHSNAMISPRSLYILFVQGLLAICTGPLIIWLIRYWRKGWEGWSGRLATRFTK